MPAVVEDDLSGEHWSLVAADNANIKNGYTGAPK